MPHQGVAPRFGQLADLKTRHPSVRMPDAELSKEPPVEAGT